jgi:hypothetical protein
MFDEIMVQMSFYFVDVYEKQVLMDDEMKQQVLVHVENDDYVNCNQRIEKEHDEV